MRHILPYLRLIIKDAYPPARWRSDMFWSTPAALANVAEYGDLTEDETAEIGELITDWIQGETGSERFELLGDKNRRAFVQDVLVPEAAVGLVFASLGHAPWSTEESMDVDESPVLNGEQTGEDGAAEPADTRAADAEAAEDPVSDITSPHEADAPRDGEATSAVDDDPTDAPAGLTAADAPAAPKSAGVDDAACPESLTVLAEDSAPAEDGGAAEEAEQPAPEPAASGSKSKPEPQLILPEPEPAPTSEPTPADDPSTASVPEPEASAAEEAPSPAHAAYSAARTRLAELRHAAADKQWARRQTEALRARSDMRARLKLPSELETAEDRTAQALADRTLVRGARGRVRSRVAYKGMQ